MKITYPLCLAFAILLSQGAVFAAPSEKSPIELKKIEESKRWIICDGTYLNHLQGIATDGESIFWSHTVKLVKTDLAGKLLKEVVVPNHHGDLTWHDGKVFVAVDLGVSSGIMAVNEWHNYAVRFDLPNSLIEVYVDEVSRGIIDLAALGGGSHDTASNAFVNVGLTAADGAREWTDNFQVGAVAPVPEPSAAILLGLAGIVGLRRRR